MNPLRTKPSEVDITFVINRVRMMAKAGPATVSEIATQAMLAGMGAPALEEAAINHAGRSDAEVADTFRRVIATYCLVVGAVTLLRDLESQGIPLR